MDSAPLKTARTQLETAAKLEKNLTAPSATRRQVQRVPLQPRPAPPTHVNLNYSHFGPSEMSPSSAVALPPASARRASARESCTTSHHPSKSGGPLPGLEPGPPACPSACAVAVKSRSSVIRGRVPGEPVRSVRQGPAGWSRAAGSDPDGHYYFSTE